MLLLTAICTTCSTVFTVIATQSPHPFLQGSTHGGILVVGLQIGIFVLGFLLRTALIEAYRDGGENEKAREFRLFIGGLTTQAAALSTAVILFLLINVFGVFKDVPLCG